MRGISAASLKRIVRHDILEMLDAPVAEGGILAKKVATLIGVSYIKAEAILRELVSEGLARDIKTPRQKFSRYEVTPEGRAHLKTYYEEREKRIAAESLPEGWTWVEGGTESPTYALHEDGRRVDVMMSRNRQDVIKYVKILEERESTPETEVLDGED